MSLLQNSNAISEGGYNIANSLRFQSASTTYLNRTFSTSGTTVTYSFWMKRGTLGVASFQIGWSNGATISWGINLLSNDTLSWATVSGGAINSQLITTQVFRDPSAWYHIVVTIDTTQATASNRIKIYVNGSQVTALSTATYPAQNTVLPMNTSNPIFMGNCGGTGGFQFDGYMTEWNLIDGQALTPSSFGETNTLTGQWVAKKYTGTYGTNGFYLPFSNGTSTTTLGADSSGNGNNWTLTNFTRSAGVSDCWMYDVPSGNGSQAGGTQPNSNYAVMNPLHKYVSGNLTVSNANLRVTKTTQSTQEWILSSIAVTSGSFYWEQITTSVAGQLYLGVANAVVSSYDQYPVKGYVYWNPSGGIYNYAGTQLNSTGYTTNDVLGFALDATNDTLALYKNGTLIYTVTSLRSNMGGTTSTDTPLAAMFWNGGANNAAVTNWNFGNRSFAYTPPSGFKALCTANLPASTIVKGNQYMDATLYTGNATARSITNAAGFAPSLVWGKCRSALDSNRLVDIVRGATKSLFSNLSNAEATESGVTAFNSNGFSLGTGAINDNGQSFVAWQWYAGLSTVSNTNGSITSQVRASSTSGVSVVIWTGTATNSTVGHGLGVAPKMMIVKSYGVSDTWRVYHESIGNTRFINLNDTSGFGTASTVWNNTSPTSTVFTVGTESSVNGSGRAQVAYCFAEIAGFSRFGSYTGNGSADGTFVYTGFTPKFIMTKRSDSTSAWVIVDTERSGYVGNVAKNRLYANTTEVEDSADTPFDILSNGFKNRTTNTTSNASGGTYIFMAFASNPFANSNAR